MPIAAQKVFTQAVYFDKAVEILDEDVRFEWTFPSKDKQRRTPSLVIPSAVGSVFSIELYMKALLAYEGVSVPRIHDIHDLFSQASESAQKLVIQRFEESVAIDTHLRREMRKYVDPAACEFRQVIAMCSSGYEGWRYCFELPLHGLRGMFATGHLRKALRDHLIEVNPIWQQEFDRVYHSPGGSSDRIMRLPFVLSTFHWDDSAHSDQHKQRDLDPVAIFAQALRFEKAVEVLDSHNNKVTDLAIQFGINNYSIPGWIPCMVTAALSLELHLKALLAVERNVLMRGHKLAALFGQVSASNQRTIRVLCAEEVEADKMCEVIRRATGQSDLYEVDQILATCNNAFHQWRYSFDSSTEPIKGVFATSHLRHAVRRATLRMKPEWTEVAEVLLRRKVKIAGLN